MKQFSRLAYVDSPVFPARPARHRVPADGPRRAHAAPAQRGTRRGFRRRHDGKICSARRRPTFSANSPRGWAWHFFAITLLLAVVYAHQESGQSSIQRNLANLPAPMPVATPAPAAAASPAAASLPATPAVTTPAATATPAVPAAATPAPASAAPATAAPAAATPAPAH